MKRTIQWKNTLRRPWPVVILLVLVPVLLAAQNYNNGYSNGSAIHCSAYLDSAQLTNDWTAKINWIQTSLDCSIKNGQLSTELIGQYALGEAYGQNHWNKAKNSFKKCLAIYPKIQSKHSADHNGVVKAVYQLMRQTYAKGQVKEAIEWHTQMPSVALSQADNRNKFDYYDLLAHIWISEFDFEKAKSIAWNDLVGLTAESSVASQLILGDVELAQNQVQEAIAYYQTAHAEALHLGNTAMLVQCNQKLADAFRKQGNIHNQLYYLNNSANYNSQSDNFLGVVQDKAQIVNAYIDSDKLDKAAEEIQSNDAYSANVITMASATNGNSMQLAQLKAEVFEENAQNYKNLANAYDEQQKYAKAIEYYKKYVIIQDSVNAARQTELEMASQLNSQVISNEQRIDLLEKERILSEQNIALLAQDSQLNHQKLVVRNGIIGGLVIFLLLSLIGGYLFVRNTRLRAKADKLITLQSLTGQMNPHFIFNALNSVNEYISNNDERSANRYLTSFSKLMRQVMDDSRKPFIPFQEELDMLQIYLKLEHARFEDRFNYRIEMDPDFDSSLYEIPPMLVQPYLENAIWHGLRYRESLGELVVQISGDAHFLRLTITDNGIGMAKSKELKTTNQRKQKSLAMKNTETRIRLINEVYHYPIQLQISTASDDIHYPGTKVQIELPNQTNTAQS